MTYFKTYNYNAIAIKTNQLRLAKNKIVRFVPTASQANDIAYF